MFSRSLLTLPHCSSRLVAASLTSIKPHHFIYSNRNSATFFNSSSQKSISSKPTSSIILRPVSSPPTPVTPYFSNLPYYSIRTFVDRERRRTRTKTRVKEDEEEQQEEQSQYRQTYVIPVQEQQQPAQAWKDYVSSPSQPAQPEYVPPQSHSLTPPVVRYLRQVWGYTGAALGIATITSAVGMMLPFVHPIIWGLASFVPLFTFYRSTSPGGRLASYLSFVGLTGLTLSALLKISLAINPMLPLAAMGITAMITVAMTAISFLTPKGGFLKFGGALFAGAIGLIGAAILGIFFPVFHTIWLYGGVLLFSAFLGYENQKTISDFENGIQDPLHHSLGFFIDIVGLFRHILVILLGRE